jgi:hypothetical protein
MSIPAASGDFAAFFPMLFDSIRPVSGTNGDVDSGDQLNQYVRPTASQLASWRAVFQSLLAGDWDSAHLQAQMISLTYNVVQFLDARTGRTYYVLMEGLPGDIPVAVDHLSGSVKITDPHDPTRRGWGTYVFDPQPQRALSLSAPHLFDCFRTEVQAAEAFLGLRARTLLLAGTDRDQNAADSPCDQAIPRRPFREADVSHTAESVFQMAFEEIYSSDATTWHLQFHGNTICPVDVFLSNGVQATPATHATLYALSANIAAASTAAAAGGADVLTVDVFDGPGDCPLRGTTNLQMRFASGLPHASICHGNVVGPSRFIHAEQSRVARLAFPNDPSTTSGRNRGVVVCGILATFPFLVL